jgi:hypothetical protein
MEGAGDNTAGLSSGQPAPVVEPPPHAIAEAGRLRMRELRTISDRLGRFPKYPVARFWWATAAVLLGGAIGGGLAAFQLNPKADAILYGVIVGVVAVLGVICLIAGFTTHYERVESIRDIKADFDALLSAYPAPDDTDTAG